MLSSIKELLGIDPEDFNWQDFGICRDTETNLFYDDYEADEQVAKMVDAMCLSCPVLAQCQRWAVENGEWGVWGGIYFTSGRPDLARNAHKTPEVWAELRERSGQSVF